MHEEAMVDTEGDIAIGAEVGMQMDAQDGAEVAREGDLEAALDSRTREGAGVEGEIESGGKSQIECKGEADPEAKSEVWGSTEGERGRGLGSPPSM